MTAKTSVQGVYIDSAITTQAPMRIRLASGREINGRVTAFDNFTVLVFVNGVEVLVYKSSIEAIGPGAESE